MQRGKLVLWFFLAVFVLLGLFDLVRQNLSAADSFIAAAFMALGLFLSRKYKISTLAAIFFGLIFVPNTIGHFGGYSWAAIDYHYDWIVHILVPIFAILAIGSFLSDNRIFKKPGSAAAVAFLIVMTLGALVEVTEYWAFRVIGFGAGYLGFGDGDNSNHYGPWENSSIDTTFNFASGILGTLIFLFLRSHNIYKKK